MNTDYLTCGQCLKEFPLHQITLFIQHKKLDCEEDSGTHFEEADLKCYYCPRGFMTAWGLLVHVQLTHSMRIFVEKTALSITSHTNGKYCDTQHICAPPLKVSPKETQEERKSLSSKSRQSILKHAYDGFSVGQALPENRDTTFDLDRSRALTSNHTIDTSYQENDSLMKLFESQSVPKGRDFEYSPSDVPKSSQIEDNQEISCTNATQSIESRPLVYSPLTKQLTQAGASKTACNSNNEKNSFDKEARLQHGETTQRSYSYFEKNNENSTGKMHTDAGEESPSKQNTSTDNEQLHEIRSDTEEGDLSDCCDDQGCGVTVIPGTHQDLQDCCNAVVPKKRKRHMELKHMPFSWSSSRYARRRMLQRSWTLASKSSTVTHSEPLTTGTKTIFIDVEPDTFRESNKPLNPDGQMDTNKENLTDSSISKTKESQSAVPVTMLPPPDSDSKAKSLILKPGAIFSIPFSYSLPNSVSGTSTSIPISIVQARLSEKQTESLTISDQTVVSDSHETVGQDQVSRSGQDETDNSPQDLVIADTDTRRRKYPTSKPFRCDKCPMAFNQRIHLKKHMSKHTGIKPYKCGECDYSTVERSHLKVHIRIHTGEKPFKCTYCEYATAQNSTLKIHLKRHHGGKMFACHDCDKTFTQMEQLQGHQSEHIGGSANMTVMKKKSPGIEIKQGTSGLERQSPGKDSSCDSVGKERTQTSLGNTSSTKEGKEIKVTSVINSGNSDKHIQTEMEADRKKN